MNMDMLNTRTRLIFQHIVESYLDSGDPVGSQTIARAADIAVSPATVRNVMSDLEEAGLLSAPHTSAGRVPTDIGLRLFVDGILEVGNLSRDERESIRGKCQASGQNIESMLSEATKNLSGLSHCASLVMVDKSETKISQIEFVPLSPGRALVVLVGLDGGVENRIASVPTDLPPSSLVMAGNYLSARLMGNSLEAARANIERELASKQSELDILTAKAVKAGLALWSGDTASPSLIVSGAANLLENVSASDDLEKIRQLLEDLESKKEMVSLLDLARGGEGVRLFIGAENNLFSLSGSSLVLAPYMNDANSVVGVVGVIGPTRLNYARIIPMVDYTAQMVSRMF